MTEYNYYSESDFAQVKFAEHPDGSLAVRMHPDYPMPWRVVAGSQPIWFADDREMAVDGWVPVPAFPENPTITESEARDAWWSACESHEGTIYNRFCTALGITVTPDPEPTNAERLEKVLRRSENDFFVPISADIHEYAEWLDEAGVKAPDNA